MSTRAIVLLVLVVVSLIVLGLYYTGVIDVPSTTKNKTGDAGADSDDFTDDFTDDSTVDSTADSTADSTDDSTDDSAPPVAPPVDPIIAELEKHKLAEDFVLTSDFNQDLKIALDVGDGWADSSKGTLCAKGKYLSVNRQDGKNYLVCSDTPQDMLPTAEDYTPVSGTRLGNGWIGGDANPVCPKGKRVTVTQSPDGTWKYIWCV